MSFVPPGCLTRDQLVDLLFKDEAPERPLVSPLEDLQAHIEEARARDQRSKARCAEAFGALQAPLYNGRIKAIILKDGREYRVPQSVWGKDNAELTFKSGYATIVEPIRHHGRLFFERADAEDWLAPAPEQITPRRGRRMQYPWADFDRELTRIANTPDGLPEVQADAEKMMTEWCAARWEREPSPSMIRERISLVYKAIRSGR
jgi:hypothetical protein